MTNSNTLIVGYADLGRYTGRSAAYWRNLASDGKLPFQKVRLGGRQVGFRRNEVDAHMRRNLPEWRGPSLDIDLHDMVTGVEDMDGILGEMINDKDALLRLMRGAHSDTARYIWERSLGSIQKAALLHIAAGVSTSERTTEKVRAALVSGDDDALILAIEGEVQQQLGDLMASLPLSCEFENSNGEEAADIRKRKGLPPSRC